MNRSTMVQNTDGMTGINGMYTQSFSVPKATGTTLLFFVTFTVFNCRWYKLRMGIFYNPTV